MNTDKYTMLTKIFTRLCLHASLEPEQYSYKRERFIASLRAYPDDLICAAYHYLSHYITPGRIPSESDFIQFMQPEFARRQQECFVMEGV